MDVTRLLSSWTVIGHLDFGSFEILGDRVRIADPIYIAEVGVLGPVSEDDQGLCELAATLPMARGLYRATALVGEHPDWGRRVIDLFIEATAIVSTTPATFKTYYGFGDDSDGDLLRSLPPRKQWPFVDICAIGNDTARMTVVDLIALPLDADAMRRALEYADCSAVLERRGVTVHIGIGDGIYQLRGAYDSEDRVVALHHLFLDEILVSVAEQLAARLGRSSV